MNVIDYIYWICLPLYNGNRLYKERIVCYRSNLQQIKAAELVLTALIERGHSSISVLSILETHHGEMLSQFRSAGTHPVMESSSNVSFCYAGGACSSANTLIILPVIATGTSYEKLIDEIRNQSHYLFEILENHKFDRVVVVGEKNAWLSIGGFLSRRLAVIPATDYPVREAHFDSDIREAVAALFSHESE